MNVTLSSPAESDCVFIQLVLKSEVMSPLGLLDHKNVSLLMDCSEESLPTNIEKIATPQGRFCCALMSLNPESDFTVNISEKGMSKRK